MRPIVCITCLAVLAGGTSVAAIATGQTAVVAPPSDPGTADDRNDPDPGGDADITTPAADRTAPRTAPQTAPVNTRAIAAEEMSVAAEEAAFDTSLSAMAAQLNGATVPDGDASAAAPAADEAPEGPPLAAIVTVLVCVVGAIGALAAIARSGLRARRKQREDNRQRRRTLRRRHTPHNPDGDAPA